MSILEKVKKQESGNKVFGLVTGKSGAGKTTLAGTLPNRTLLLQVRGKEFGAETAKAIAAKNGNKLDAYSVSTPEELLAIAEELTTDKTYDNVYVDGITALTNIIAEEPEIRNLVEARKGGNPWAGYERINTRAVQVREAFAPLVYESGADKPKHVFFTLAVRVDVDGENEAALAPEMKGKATYSTFTRPSPTIIHVGERTVEVSDGEVKTERVLVIKNHGPIVARVNGVLDEDNPGIIAPDLSQLLALIGGKHGK